MVSELNNNKDGISLDEDEIFKSLSNKIRRDIIKVLGDGDKLSFTDIKKNLNSIDSPTLSYHLKSLKYLLDQKGNLYFLTEVGKAALMLMDKIDQSDRLKKNKRRFLYANLFTIFCWATMQIAIPNIIRTQSIVVATWTIIILLQIFAQMNYFIIFTYWSKTWKIDKKKKSEKTKI